MSIGDGLSRAERETIISRSDADDAWNVYTSSPHMARKLQKLCDAMDVTLVPVGTWGVRCLLPVRCVSLRRLVELSDDEKQRRADVLRQSRAA